jgi:predicted ATPase/predicted Ser/Thr protein kinase
MAVMPSSGSRIGSYRVQRELGRGGMGHVFLAEHVSLGRKVALKLLAPDLASDQAFRERFVRESQLIAAIEHPNMIPIFDAGEVDGVLFIAMRYVEGYDLRSLVDREGRLAADHALEIVAQVAAALDAAHAREIVHRDVKPENILIDVPTDRVYLTDFSIAKSGRSSVTQPGVFIGTVAYAAPEQIQGQGAGPPTDVYALGCVLYEALTGERPFPKESDIAVLFGHMLDPAPPVSAKRPDLPAPLDDVVRRALAKAEEERYSSCGELVAAAREALRSGAAVADAPVPPLEPPAALAAARRDRTNLPAPEGRLVGRAHDLAAVLDALRDDAVRLLTLTGPGGTGKTRLALQVGSGLTRDFQSGVCFVGLAAINDPALVLPSVVAALGVEERGGEDDPGAAAHVGLLEAARIELAGERLLVILDSFEHLLPAAATVSELLAALPLLKVLVTSRSLLHVRGEREHVVAPLELPDPGACADLAVLAESPAVALFVDRAVEVSPGFSLDDDNAPAVVEICRRLDGLPLAIELAAARMRLLTPQAVAARLENRLQLLTGGARDLPSRHQTLRGTIDWSYELLDEPARTFLARSAVFADGFTFDAAEQVCATGELDSALLVDALGALVDESLLRRREEAGGAVRFAMLQTIREYALFRLIERRELDDLRARHAFWLVALAESAEPQLVGPDQAVWMRRLDDEAGNVRAALNWSLDSGDVATGLRIAGALFRLWSSRGQLSEARIWLDRALFVDAAVAAEVRAKGLFAAGYCALGQGDFAEAVSRFEESLYVYSGQEDRAGVAHCLAQLGWLLTARGEPGRGKALSDESLALARELGEPRTTSLALVNLGDAAFAEGDYSTASDVYAEALEVRRALGDVRTVADALLKAGRAQALAGDRERAVASLEEGLQLARGLGDGWTTSVALASLAFVALLEDDAETAAPLLGEALDWAGRRGDKRLIAECAACLAAAAALRGDHDRAARLWGAADAARAEIGAAISPVERFLVETRLPVLRASLGEERLEAARTEGAQLRIEDAVADAVG